MYDVNNLNAIARGDVEDEPIREVSHGPATKPPCRGSAETAQTSHSGHLCERLKTFHKLVEKTFCGFQPRFFFQIVKVTADFTPCKGTDSKERHLDFG